MSELRHQYLKELRFAMTVACFVFAFPIWAGVVSGDWFFAVCGYAAAELHFWLCSVTPTEQWLKDRKP